MVQGKTGIERHFICCVISVYRYFCFNFIPLLIERIQKWFDTGKLCLFEVQSACFFPFLLTCRFFSSSALTGAPGVEDDESVMYLSALCFELKTSKCFSRQLLGTHDIKMLHEMNGV